MIGIDLAPILPHVVRVEGEGKFYDPTIPEQSTLDQLEPGKMYMIEVDQPVVLQLGWIPKLLHPGWNHIVWQTPLMFRI